MTEYDPRVGKICRILNDDAVGPENAISSKELAARVGIDDGEARPVTRRLVRQVMRFHLRPIASTNEGYFIVPEDSPELARKEIESLEHRAEEIRERRRLFEAAMDREFQQSGLDGYGDEAEEVADV